MTLTLAEVEHIANLARLHLSEAEKELYRWQLSAILEYAARLQAVDTAAALPEASAAPAAVTALRPDQAQAGLDLDNLLRNAPDVAQEQFRVLPVLE